MKDLFENIGIANAEDRAIQFYANMFFFYSMHDGSADKNEVKRQFEHMIMEILKEIE